MKKIDLNSPELYINRELSQLAFNARVCALARDKNVPLLERLRFLCIVSANLDEFFEIRVANLKDRISVGDMEAGPDGLNPQQVLGKISEYAHEIVSTIYHSFNKELLPELENNGISFIPHSAWDNLLTKWVKNKFFDEILPLLSPVGLDTSHPMPRLVNKSLNFIVTLQGTDAFGRDSGIAIVQAPRVLPRVFQVPEELANHGDRFVLLTSIIQAHMQELFPGMSVTGCYQFRLTRNSDLYLDDITQDLANALKDQLRSRHFGHVARLEIAADCPESVADFLLNQHGLEKQDLYLCNGPVNLNRYLVVLDLLNHSELRYPPFTPAQPMRLRQHRNIFQAIQEQDLLLHHPFQSFTPVLDLIRQGTQDPNVLAIKQTLYRTGPGSSIVKALVDAARAGKEVTAVIELRARLDEETNIALANTLQEAGALVIYGVIGFKTHAKLSLVVRREGKRLVRYAHLGTGNYHERTATSYVDLGLMTCDPAMTNDVQKIFQLLTGMGRGYRLQKCLHSPFTLYRHLKNAISKEIANAKAGKTARIIMKANGLSDPQIIRDLYAASSAGVKVDLLIRGICCLRPGIAGVSDNIRVRSTVGQFLEHARIYYFHNGGDEKIYCSSADLMERNLYHRVEVCFPIETPRLAKRIKQEALLPYLADSAQSWRLRSNGVYEKVKPRNKKISPAQQVLLDKFK